jgi:[ribosomal protein S5]-alanine N-acetyltransferase
VTSLVAETPRLILREQTEDDLAPLLSVLGDEETMSFYPRPYTPEEVLAWIRRNMRRYRERGFGLWAVVLKESERVVGQVGLVPQQMEDREEIEVGWQINRRVWRRGYATEAAIASRDLAFVEHRLGHLVSLVRPDNVPSASVARRLGMTVHRQIVRSGMVHDVWRITRRTWEELRDR